MPLLDDATWQSKIYSGGWVDGSGGTVRRRVTRDRRAARHRWARPPRPTSTRRRPRAADAQRAWAAPPYNERAAVLRRAGDLWHANAEEITGWLMRETGAIGPFGGFQIMTSAEECYEAAALRVARRTASCSGRPSPRLSMARRVPVGVVGVIAPFNVPTILSIRAVAPALALGNAVLLKPDPRTAVAGGAVLAEIFAQAGLPDGLLHVLPGGADVGEALVTEPAVRVISFTGSTRAGRAVASAGRRSTSSGCTSSSAATRRCSCWTTSTSTRPSSVGAWGSFAHQGQVCMATGRHLVQRGIADEYIAALAARADQLPVGDPTAGRWRSGRSSTPGSATGSTRW